MSFSTMPIAAPAVEIKKQPDHIIAYNRAKVGLMLRKDAVFFTSVYFSLRHIWDEAHPTAYTNGTVVAFNPEFFLSLTQDERIFLMLHEALHVAFMHMDRLGTRRHSLWNQAADHAINLLLKEKGFVMPDAGLADVRFKDMAADQIYKILETEQPEGTNGPPCMDDLRAPSNPGELRRQVEDILVKAAIRAKQENADPGMIPGDIQIKLNKLLNPKLPWQQILQRFLSAFTKNDYTFLKPNRRFLPDFWMPSLHSQSLQDVAIAVDTSGSVSNAEFTAIVSEIASIFRMLRPNKITLVQFDTAIKSVDAIHNIRELVNAKFTGRGGTNIDPVIKWAKEKKPQLLLIFSDGEFHSPHHTHTGPIIWLVYNNPHFTAPFGKVIRYEIE